MANAQKPDVTEDEVKHATDLWVSFTKGIKWGTVLTILAVIGLALITL